jgi:hypothetical protein
MGGSVWLDRQPWWENAHVISQAPTATLTQTHQHVLHSRSCPLRFMRQIFPCLNHIARCILTVVPGLRNPHFRRRSLGKLDILITISRSGQPVSPCSNETDELVSYSELPWTPPVEESSCELSGLGMLLSPSESTGPPFVPWAWSKFRNGLDADDRLPG